MSSVPIICRGDQCPYLETCYLDSQVRNQAAAQGGRCPIEIAALLQRFDQYCQFFGTTEEDVVDMGLIRELVDVEIQTLRCDNKIATEADFIEMTIAGISNQGVPYTRPELKVGNQYKEKLRGEKHRIYKLLDSTREDRAKRNGKLADPSMMAVTLIEKMRQLEKDGLLRGVSMVNTDIDPIDAEIVSESKETDGAAVVVADVYEDINNIGA
jgi:hypothetical protein